jgi:hypothetical protein
MQADLLVTEDLVLEAELKPSRGIPCARTQETPPWQIFSREERTAASKISETGQAQKATRTKENERAWSKQLFHGVTHRRDVRCRASASLGSAKAAPAVS